ncbi:MAG: dihydroorotase family protein [Spirochaetes bacterium]|jgi:dihydroorotase|nr:dihydroorotase family protein [Spirochaetota bacterium]
MDLLITGCNLFGKEVNIGIDSGMIAYVGDDRPIAQSEYDLGGRLVLPGMIDPHVHMRDMEQSDKEDWLTGTKAALAGGVTSLIDMPNTLPPTNNRESLNRKREAARKSLVNYGFYAGVGAGSLDELEELFKHDADVLGGVKVFLAETSSNEVIESAQTIDAILMLAKQYSRSVLFHHELFSSLKENKKKYLDDRYNDVVYHDSIRSRSCEEDGIALIIDAAERTGCRVYVCHVSTSSGFEMIARAKKKGVPVYLEATPHHLFLNYTVAEKAGNFAKINPPLRSERDRVYLYGCLQADAIDIIGSDHAPHQIELKKASYENAPSGFPGLETSLPLLIDCALKGDITFEQVADLTSGHPAAWFGISGRGKIAKGYYADFVVVDKGASWKVDANAFFGKAKFSPFEGKKLRGKIVQTWVNGQLAFDKGVFTSGRVGEALRFENVTDLK